MTNTSRVLIILGCFSSLLACASAQNQSYSDYLKQQAKQEGPVKPSAATTAAAKTSSPSDKPLDPQSAEARAVAKEASEAAVEFAKVEEYRYAVAKAIYRDNPSLLSSGAVQPLLRAVVVLNLRVDATGKLDKVTLLRSGADKALNPVAINAVERTKLPLPSRNILQGNAVDFDETFLFNNDGRFQLYSFKPQQRGD
jgi:protein TonB